MSALESIRKRAKLLVIAIGAAMLVFILEDALRSGKFFFQKNANAVAVADGKVVKYQNFMNFVDNLDYYNEAALQTTALDDKTKKKIVQSAFAEMTMGITLLPQDKKLGITVTDNEMDELMHGPNFSPEAYKFYFDKQGRPLRKQFIDPKTGRLNYRAMRQYINAVLEKDNSFRAQWALTNDDIRNVQLRNKYFYLLYHGLFVTDAEAKQVANEDNRYYNISYILKRYTGVPDNSITISNDDRMAWYKKHAYEFMQPVESRRIDYVLYPAIPTPKDLTDLQNNVDSLTVHFKTTAISDAFSYVMLNSDVQTVDSDYHKEGTLDNPVIDSAMSNAQPGDVFGPFKENNEYTLAKLVEKTELPDSVKVAHIVIPVPQKDKENERAKELADSIRDAATPDNFGELAQKYPYDEKSAANGGDMGWLPLYSKQLWPQEEHAAFFSSKGDIKLVKVPIGYIIILIEDQSSKSEYLKVATLIKNIEASDATKHKVYALASAFAGNNSTSDLFEKAVKSRDRRIADVKENDQQLSGMTSPKDLIRWVYENKKGNVSDPIDIGNNTFAVVHIMRVTKKGQIPYQQVKNKVNEMVLQDKKAQKLIAGFNSSRQGISSIQALSLKTGSTVSTAHNLSFQSIIVPGLGEEPALVGTMSGIKPGVLSQPIKGELGVYLLQVDSVYDAFPQTDYLVIQHKLQQDLRNRVTTDAYNALLKKLDFENHLGKYGF